MLWGAIILAIIMFIIFNFDRIAELFTSVLIGIIVFGALLWLMMGV